MPLQSAYDNEIGSQRETSPKQRDASERSFRREDGALTRWVTSPRPRHGGTLLAATRGVRGENLLGQGSRELHPAAARGVADPLGGGLLSKGAARVAPRFLSLGPAPRRAQRRSRRGGGAAEEVVEEEDDGGDGGGDDEVGDVAMELG
ncbi:unnamed protein product [Lampetra planeri]